MTTKTGHSGPRVEYDPSRFPAFAVTVDIVILTMISSRLHVVLVRRGVAPFKGMWAIPGGFKRPSETLDEAAKRELAESRANLEKMLNEEVRLFSFPYGDFNKKLVLWCRESGYHRVFTISPTLAFSNPEEFVTGRIEVEATDWPIEFRLKVLGAYRWLPLAFALKQKILSSSLLNGILRGRGRPRETTRLQAAPPE